MEAPGTAPGSTTLISPSVYRHSRQTDPGKIMKYDPESRISDTTRDQDQFCPFSGRLVTENTPFWKLYKRRLDQDPVILLLSGSPGPALRRFRQRAKGRRRPAACCPADGAEIVLRPRGGSSQVIGTRWTKVPDFRYQRGQSHHQGSVGCNGEFPIVTCYDGKVFWIHDPGNNARRRGCWVVGPDTIEPTE